jgi:hypothetical protein
MYDGLLGRGWVHCRALVLLSLALMLSSAGYAQAADAPQELAHAFTVSIASKIESTVNGETQKIEADTKLAYTWRVRGRNRVLSFDSIQVKAVVDGKEIMNQLMSRTGYSVLTEGQTNKSPQLPLSEPRKQLLEASFGIPVLAIEFDESGKETKRTNLLDPEKKSLIDRGQIANAVFFHPQFVPDQPQWKADAELSTGGNALVKGKLTYTKAPNQVGGQATRVSGALTNAVVKSLDGPPEMKNVRYEVSGEQTYEPARREWTTGKFSIDVSYQLADGDHSLGAAKGKMLVRLEELRAQEAFELPPPPK